MSFRITHRIGLLAAAIVLGASYGSVATAASNDGRSPDTKEAAILAHVQIVAQADGRSADTRDAADSAQLIATELDLRSSDTIDAAVAAHETQPSVDLRSPDTRDAAIAVRNTPTPSVVIVGNGGFDWTDAGIGAAGGFAIALLAGGALVLLRGGRGRLAL